MYGPQIRYPFLFGNSRVKERSLDLAFKVVGYYLSALSARYELVHAVFQHFRLGMSSFTQPTTEYRRMRQTGPFQLSPILGLTA